MLPTRKALLFVLLACLVGVAPSRLIGQTANPAASGLTNQDVSEMLKGGLSPDVIIAKIKTGSCNFDTSPEALRSLKDSGAPDNLIVAMVEAPAATKKPIADELGEKEAANSETAYLRVYRPHRFTGSALAPSLYVDGKPIARVGSGRRVTVKLNPGTHSVNSDDKSSAISLDAKPGQEYFVRVDEEAGFWKGHGKLTMLAAEQGSPEYRLQKPVEDNRKISKDMIENDAEGKE
jgi:hypothetical protein